MWQEQEPAFFEFWTAAPATLRACSALDAEEGGGACLDFLSSCIAAYLVDCGIDPGSPLRLPPLGGGEVSDVTVSVQFTLQRKRKLPRGRLAVPVGGPPFRLEPLTE
jgi:hypothetical protein